MAGRRKNLIAVVLLSSVVLLPAFIKRFDVRYIAYLLPLVYVLIGDSLAGLWHRLISRDAGVSGAGVRRRLQIAAAASIFVVIAATPLMTLARHYKRLGAGVGTNRTFFDLLQSLRVNGACNDMVFLENTEMTAVTRNDHWAYFTVVSVRYVLTLDSCPFEFGPAAQLLKRLENRNTGAWLILSNQSVNTFSERLRLRKVFDVSPASPSSPDLRLALYSTHSQRD